MIIDLARHDGETEISKNRSRSVWKDEAAEMLLIVRFQSPLGQKSGPVHNLRSTFSRTRNSEARTFDGTNGGSVGERCSPRVGEKYTRGREEKVGETKLKRRKKRVWKEDVWERVGETAKPAVNRAFRNRCWPVGPSRLPRLSSSSSHLLPTAAGHEAHADALLTSAKRPSRIPKRLPH